MADEPIPEITKDALMALGIERLANILVEHADRDDKLAQKLVLALAATGAPDRLVEQLSKEIDGIAADDDFIGYGASRGVVEELDTIKGAIVTDVLPRDPNSAASLLERFIDLHVGLIERSDDSDGMIADVFRDAVADWGRAWAAMADREPALVAGVVFDAHTGNDYGVLDHVIEAFGDALGEPGLAALETMLQNAIGKLPRTSNARDQEVGYRKGQLRRGLMEIADLRRDPDQFIDVVNSDDLVQAHAVEIAKRLIAADRHEEALDWLRRAEPNFATDYDRIRLTIQALDGLGRHEEAQAVRWDQFTRSMSARHLKDFLSRLPDESVAVAREAAIKVTMAHGDPLSALSLLTEIDAQDASAELVLARLDALDGNAYYVLRPAAVTLANQHPLSAALLYRKLVTAVLERGASAQYHYAVSDLKAAEKLAVKVPDWGSHGDHQAFLDDLRQQHRRKWSFWKQVDGR